MNTIHRFVDSDLKTYPTSKNEYEVCLAEFEKKNPDICGMLKPNNNGSVVMVPDHDRYDCRDPKIWKKEAPPRLPKLELDPDAEVYVFQIGQGYRKPDMASMGGGIASNAHAKLESLNETFSLQWGNLSKRLTTCHPIHLEFTKGHLWDRNHVWILAEKELFRSINRLNMVCFLHYAPIYPDFIQEYLFAK
jgi:hypothetical protein